MSKNIKVSGDKNITAGRDIKITQFIPLIIFLSTILTIGAVTYYYPTLKQQSTERNTSFCKEESPSTNILILPFYSYLNNTAIDSDCQRMVFDEMTELKSTNDLPIEIKRLSLMNYYPGGDTKKAIEIGRSRCAKIVVWGSCNESKENTVSKIKVSLLDPDFFKGALHDYESFNFWPNQSIDLGMDYSIQNLEKLSYLIGAISYYNSGDYSKAKELFLKVDITELGESCEDIRNYLNWATTYFYLGDSKMSEKLANQALIIAKKELCGRQEEADIYDQLSSIYSAYYSKNEKAKELSLEAIRLIESIPENQDSILGYLYTNLASVYRAIEEYDSAFSYQDKALKLFSESTQPSEENELNISYMLYNFSVINLALGKYNRALFLGDSALQMQKKILPNSHIQIAKSIGNISRIHWNMGNKEKALQYQREALIMKEQVLPKNHLELGSASHNYSTISNSNYFDINDALKYEKKAIKIFESQTVIDTSRLAKAYKQLFSICKNLNNLEEGKKYLDTAFALNLSYNNGDRLHSSMLYYYNDFTYYYYVKEEYESALKMADTALVILGKLAPNRVAILYNNKAILLAKVGKCDESMELTNKAIEYFKNSEIPENSYLFYDAYLTIAEVYICKEDFDNAIKYGNMVKQFYEASSERTLSDNFKFAETLNVLALSYCQLGKKEMALDLNNRALNLIDGKLPNGYHLIDKIMKDINWIEKRNSCKELLSAL